jgi:hypothetical protein
MFDLIPTAGLRITSNTISAKTPTCRGMGMAWLVVLWGVGWGSVIVAGADHIGSRIQMEPV